MWLVSFDLHSVLGGEKNQNYSTVVYCYLERNSWKISENQPFLGSVAEVIALGIQSVQESLDTKKYQIVKKHEDTIFSVTSLILHKWSNTFHYLGEKNKYSKVKQNMLFANFQDWRELKWLKYYCRRLWYYIVWKWRKKKKRKKK